MVSVLRSQAGIQQEQYAQFARCELLLIHFVSEGKYEKLVVEKKEDETPNVTAQNPLDHLDCE